jgi:hypothetical protein
MRKCLECNSSIGSSAFSKHLFNEHNLTVREYLSKNVVIDLECRICHSKDEYEHNTLTEINSPICSNCRELSLPIPELETDNHCLNCNKTIGNKLNKTCCKSCHVAYNHKVGTYAHIDRSISSRQIFVDYPHLIEDMRKRTTQSWKDGVYDHINHSENSKKAYDNNPELRKRVSDKMKKIWKNGSFNHIDWSEKSKKPWREGKYLNYLSTNKRYKTGVYPSCKAGNIHFRSGYEEAAFILLDELRSVISYQVEPFIIPMENGSSYTPDILVHYDDGYKLLVEVKPKSFIFDESVQYKRQQAELFLKNNPHIADEYTFWTEDDIFIN